MWLMVYSNDHAPLTVRPIYSSSKLRTAQMMIFSLVVMIGLEKCCITSAYLQWLCHSGELTVARGPLCFNVSWYLLRLLIDGFIPIQHQFVVFILIIWTHFSSFYTCFKVLNKCIVLPGSVFEQYCQNNTLCRPWSVIWVYSVYRGLFIMKI